MARACDEDEVGVVLGQCCMGLDVVRRHFKEYLFSC
jgi:hypothetical protein